MTDETRLDLLREEYLHLQSTIEAFDERALSIKAWSVTFSLTAIAGAFATESAFVLTLAGVSAVLFWILEALWKTFQDGYMGRARALEDWFAATARGEPIAGPEPLQIGRDFQARVAAGGFRRFLVVATRIHVALPHAFVVLLAAGLWAAVR